MNKIQPKIQTKIPNKIQTTSCPVLAIVGRPNVGKSTFFNCLTRSRQALVADRAGLTRDRLYALGALGEYPFQVIDTAGLKTPETPIESLILDQLEQAIQEADAILFVVDARHGLDPIDREMASRLRTTNKPIALIVNKTDGLEIEGAQSDFYRLGFAMYPISASHNRGILPFIEEFQGKNPALFSPEDNAVDEAGWDQSIKIAIIGRPNVGKSTLTNRLLKADRVLVFDKPGTTLDSVYIQMSHYGKAYTLIDTAGVRRHSRIIDTIEKFSVCKSFDAIKDAHVVLLMLDAQEDVVDQDLRLLEMILEAGRAVVILINKWDGLDADQKKLIRTKIGYRFNFAPNLHFHYISALHGTGVGEIFSEVDLAYKSANQELTTNQLTKILEQAVTSHPPPTTMSGRIKLRYAHCGGHNPPVVIIHGNQTDDLPEHYKRYLVNTFSKALKLIGTPLKIYYKKAENPYSGKRNSLTPRQIKKRKRLMTHVRKK